MTFLLIAHCSGRVCRPCSGCPGSWSGSSWAEAGPRDGNQRAGAQDALLAEIRSQRIRRGDAARQHLDCEAREWRVRAKRDHAEQRVELRLAPAGQAVEIGGAEPLVAGDGGRRGPVAPGETITPHPTV